MELTVDDLLKFIGKLYVEKETILLRIAEQEAGKPLEVVK